MSYKCWAESFCWYPRKLQYFFSWYKILGWIWYHHEYGWNPLLFQYDIVCLISNFTAKPKKSPVASAVFWIAFSEVVVSESVADCLVWPRRFWLYLPFKCYLYFYQYFCSYFLAKDKYSSPLTNVWSLGANK